VRIESGLMSRPLRLAIATQCILAAPSIARETAPTFAGDVQPFLKQHCYACHGAEKQEASLRYDRMTGYQVEQRKMWAQVYEMLSSGKMPPGDRPRPPVTGRQRVLAWIRQQAAQADKAFGTGSLRRLNRRELSAALQDLTGLTVDYAGALPGDGKIAGFDTGAAGLQDAADSVAQVMQVTRRAVDGIRFLKSGETKVLAADLRAAKDFRQAFDPWKSEGAVAKGRAVVRQGLGLLVEPTWVGERGGLEITVPVPAGGRGVLRLQLTIAAFKPRAGVPHPHLWLEVGAKDLDVREITSTPEKPIELVYEVQLEDLAVGANGVPISLSNKVEIPYAVEGFENEDRSKPEEKIPGGTGLFRPAFDRRSVPLDQQPVPFLVIQRIQIEPGYVAPWPPPSWKSPVGKLSDDEHTAKRLLGLWMERAYRRPVNDAEQQRFLTLYRSVRAKGQSFDDALRAAFQSVLLSAGFRFLPSPADRDLAVGQHAIASRLSFMVTGSPPDEELRRLAAARKLRDGTVLEAQIDRLLDDPRSDGFVRPFVTQWLELGQPITIAMDHIQKQDFRFGRYLKASMQEETIAYVARLLAENRPAQELIVSDWAMMNDSLAVHYRYEGIESGQLRKVKLRANDPRGGGLLGQAGIQSMLCWMGENWVIYRGAWTLRHILDDPPPPPPLEVPELVPSDNKNHGKTFKELLRQHQEDAKCAVCHKSIDPLGFAFQNFDISGRWRAFEHERYETSELDGKVAWRGTGKTRPVDAVGQLPRGERFSSFDECKQLMVKNYLDDIVRGLLKNFMIYATGRTPDAGDLAEIQGIIEAYRPRRYPLRDLLKEVARSKAFLDH
jgi:hypothetical protein